MAPSNLKTLADLTALLLALLSMYALRSWHKYRQRQRQPPLPPGPKGLPLLGNTLNMLVPEIWESARKWGEQYGPLIHVESLGTSYIFVNSYEAAVDLFEKRGSNYSSRPSNAMIELEGWDWLTAMTPYGEELRKLRRTLHRFFHVVDEYADLQMQSTYKMMERLLKQPDKYLECIQHSVGEVILKIAYGYQVQEENDPLVGLVERGLQFIAEAEGFFIVNIIPWLRHLPSWLPGMGFHQIANEAREYSRKMYHEPHEAAKKKFMQGTAIPSMSSKLCETSMIEDGQVLDEEVIKKATGVAYVAGADTTVSALHTFFLAMVLYPDVQRRAQAELDRVIGPDSLPTLADRPKFPYIEAIVKETLRWQAVAPCAVAHTIDKDDEYNGFFMPSGAIVFPNLWAILRNPKDYPRPDEFIPERWMGKEPPLDVHKVVFGIGRRICPGRHFATNSIFIVGASMLSAFKIWKALDEDGAEIIPKAEFTPHLIRHPMRFPYSLTPRSAKIETLIRQAIESSK